MESDFSWILKIAEAIIDWYALWENLLVDLNYDISHLIEAMHPTHQPTEPHRARAKQSVGVNNC